MTLQLEKQIQEAFSDLKNLTPEKLQGLIQETMKTFMDLQTKARSENQADRDEAIKTAFSIKETLQTQTESLCQKLGMDPSQLALFAETPSNFTGEEWDQLNIAKREMEAFKKEFVPEQKTAPIVKKTKKTSKTWLVG